MYMHTFSSEMTDSTDEVPVRMRFSSHPSSRGVYLTCDPLVHFGPRLHVYPQYFYPSRAENILAFQSRVRARKKASAEAGLRNKAGTCRTWKSQYVQVGATQPDSVSCSASDDGRFSMYRSRKIEL